MNERTIWNERQNHPELVVQDCILEFGLNDNQAEKLRFILMRRGVNKWLMARVYFIRLKHEVKAIMKKNPSDKNLRYIQEKMQNIARSPRWVEWPKHVHKKMKNNISKLVIKGRHC